MPSSPADPAIARRAAEWMARLWSDDASEQDRADCARWRAQHPDHERAWQTLLAFEDKLAGVQPQAGGHALRRAVSGTGRRRAMRLLGLGALLAGSGYALRGTDAWRGVTADYHSGTGEIRALTLPDGTRLTLSTGTAIDLRFDANARLVVLLAGEILVATAPDPAATPRPFRVRGRHGTVQALGTRFTVREDDEDARVAVFEGAVEIRPAGAPDAAIRLDAGQGSRFPATGPTRPPRSARTRHPGAEACWWPTPGGWTTSWPSWAATGPACCAATPPSRTCA
ncbi:FecR domain-containing protein [Achromobacter xylosoxidans]